MTEQQIMDRLEQIKTEEIALKALLKVMKSEPKAKREPVPVRRESSFVRMAERMVNSKWEA